MGWAIYTTDKIITIIFDPDTTNKQVFDASREVEEFLTEEFPELAPDYELRDEDIDELFDDEELEEYYEHTGHIPYEED